MTTLEFESGVLAQISCTFASSREAESFHALVRHGWAHCRPSYRKPQADEAWAKRLAWFKANLA